jgi:hypothetical protein
MMWLNNKQRTLVFAGLLLLAGCNGPEPKDEKTEMDELWKRELANQEKAKSGNKNPEVTIITDPGEVSRLRNRIKKKIVEKQKADAATVTKNLSLCQRYKKNDKSVVSAILAVLRSNDQKKKSEVYDELEKDYDDPDNYVITEPALVARIFKGIDDPADEVMAVQLAGLNKIPGYEKHFEKRLLSGQSVDEGRIFFWLGEAAKCKESLAYMSARIKKIRLPEKQLDNVISGLVRYGENGDQDIRNMVGEMAIVIYQGRMMAEQRIEDLKMSAYTSDAAEGLLQCLFNYGDKRVVPVAKDILQRNIRIEGPVKALLRLEGPQHMSKIYALLRSEENFFKGLDLVESIDSIYVTDELLKETLVQLAKRQDIEDYVVERIVRSFTSLKAETYLENADKYINNKTLADRIIKVYALKRVSFDDILADLARLKLLVKKPDGPVLAKMKKESDGEPASFIYGLLEHQQTHHAFDAETGFVPADYDALLMEFASKSKGILKDMLVEMEVKENRDGDSFEYTLTVIANNKAFIAHPQDMGDWYDIMTVNAILDKVLNEIKSPERFVSLETGDQTVQYIFGDPAKVEELIKKYRL